MGCCLAAIISDFPSAATSTSKTTTTFLSKIAKGEEESAVEIAGFVPYDDDPAGTFVAASTSITNDENVLDLPTKTATTVDVQVSPQECHTPPSKEARKSAVENVSSINDMGKNATPSRYSTSRSHITEKTRTPSAEQKVAATKAAKKSRKH